MDNKDKMKDLAGKMKEDNMFVSEEHLSISRYARLHTSADEFNDSILQWHGCSLCERKERGMTYKGDIPVFGPCHIYVDVPLSGIIGHVRIVTERKVSEQNPELTYTVEGSQLRGKPELKCEADTQSPAGDYDIFIDKGSVENLNVTYVGGTLTVTKVLLTVSVGKYSRKEGEDNPVFTILYEGFKNGETTEVLLAEPVATTEATIDSPVGEYDIVISGGEAQNYEFNYVNGKLTVIESSGIAEIMASGSVNVYTLDGLLVAKEVKTLKGLPRGTYILRYQGSHTGGKTARKVMVK